MLHLSACIVSLLLVTATQAENAWPRFRGPNGQGVARSAHTPVVWDESHTLWRVKLDGPGHGSPVIWGNRLLLLVGDAGNAAVKLVCYDTTDGDKLWEDQHACKPMPMHKMNDFASTTPAVGEQGVFISWADGESFYLAGYSLDGKRLWKKSFGVYESRHGYSRSPILVDGLVYLASNQQSDSFVAAFDPATGGEKWRTQLPAGKASYDTPCVVPTHDGGKAIVMCSSELTMDALDAATGKKLWSMPGVLPQRCVASPIYAGGMVIASSGSGGGGKRLVAVRPPAAAGEEPTLAYDVAKGAPYVPSPLAVGDLLLLWHERGTLACFDLASGQRLWEERIGGKFFASPIVTATAVYGVSMDGEAVALSVDRHGCEELARSKLGEPTEATPAVVGDRLYVRTEGSLMCIGSSLMSLSE